MSENEKTIIFIDDTIDAGKEPLPVTPEVQRIFDKWEKIHNSKSNR